MGEDKATLRQLAREAWCVGFYRDKAMFEAEVHSRLVWVDGGKISHVGCDTYLACVSTVSLEGGMVGSAKSCNDLEQS